MLKFLLAGLPAFLLAVPLNWFLVGIVGAPKLLAYGSVLCFQVVLNFFVCRAYVFTPNSEKSKKRQFVTFAAGVWTARVLDWLLYGVLTSHLGVHYLLAQVFNVFVFSLAKFTVAKAAFEGTQLARATASPEQTNSVKNPCYPSLK